MTTATDASSWDPVAALIKRLGDEFRVMTASSRTPDDATIAEAEAQLGVRFPEEYKVFLRRYGVLYVDVDEATWRRPGEYEIRPSWQMGYGRVVAGIAAGLHPDLAVVAQTQAVRARGVDGFVPVLREMIGNGELIGYDASGALVRWSRDGVTPCGDTLVARVIASLAQLEADRERLRVEPIAAAPAASATSDARSYTVTLVLRHDRDARLAAVEAALAALRAEHQVEVHLELIGCDDDGNDRVAAHPLTLADLVDDEDALARVIVDGLEAQICFDEALDLDADEDTDPGGFELTVGVLGDPRKLPIGAAIHAAFEREVAGHGAIVSITRNWESWADDGGA